MKAGPLTERITLLEPVRAGTASGAKSTEWRERGTYRAQLKSASGFGEINAAEVFGGQRAQFNLRDNIKVTDKMRVQHLGGLLYKVIAPPQRTRALGMQTIICERVNL